MATERVVEREVPTDRVVVTDSGRGSGGNAMAIIFGLVLLAAVIIGGIFLMNAQRNDAVRTEAVSNAASNVADSVGSAASSVGDAAQNAAGAVTGR